MVAGSLSRGLAILETLVGAREGLPLTRVAEAVGLPKSAAHRILTSLVEEGFVHQPEGSSNYALTLRIVSLGLRQLASNTVYDLAVPVLEKLAAASGQLVRLSLVDREQLVWVAKAQGARSGLRYDPDPNHGSKIPLGTSASGLAWLSQLSDDQATRLIARQDDLDLNAAGHNAPKTIDEIVACIHQTRETGWARVHDSIEEGISAMAAAVVDPDSGRTVGAVSIAGPSIQLSDSRMAELAPDLRQTVSQLSGVAFGLRPRD